MSDKNTGSKSPALSIIPNLFTLLNLIFGCIAIVFILQTGQGIVILNEQTGAYDPLFPEKMAWGAVFIFLAALIDFLDGFVARMLKATSAMGGQLDSLCDMVSFGVAPSLILYQLLRLGYAQQENGLDISFAALLPAFLFAAAVAWRLAKFNISTDQADSFKGVPSPAAALIVASFPLIIWNQYFNLQGYFINVWILYAVIIILAYLMISNSSFLALKFKDYSFKNNSTKYLLLMISVVLIVVFRWLSVPMIFLVYVIFSLFFKPAKADEKTVDRPTLDVTV